MIDQPDKALDALRSNAEQFEQSVFAEEKGAFVANAALLNRDALGFMLFRKNGLLIDIADPEWMPKVERFSDLEALAVRHSIDHRLLTFEHKEVQYTHAIWAPVSETDDWNLPLGIREAITKEKADRIVLVAGGVAAGGLIYSAAGWFGLSDLQRRVVGAIVRTGSARAAANELGIAYSTVRESLALAAKRMSLPNMPAIVSAIVSAAFGIMPGELDGTIILSDMLQISERQARIALLVSNGASRKQAAQAVGVSDGVVKKELDNIFASLGVRTAAELAKLIAEIQALRLFARSTAGAPGFLDPAIEPSRFSIRPEGRQIIGWSDYGPVSGKPVLVVHSNWSCRAVPRPLVLTLQKQGWRPIAIDRPGYGATHLGQSTRENPFAQAVDDTIQILDQLNIKKISIIARCGAQFVHVLKRRIPNRIEAVVLVSPTPATDEAGQRIGVVGSIKEAFSRSPRLIEFFFRIICAQITLSRVEQLTRAIVKGSVRDTELCGDPQFIRDRFRALRPFAGGNFMGAVYEEMVISHGGYDLPPLSVTNWAIVQGDDDNHNSFDEVINYWSPLVPNAKTIKVQGGGRFLTSSHAEQIASILEEL